MGKGQIMGGGTDGLYTVKLIQNRDKINARIGVIDTQVADYEARIAALDAQIAALLLLAQPTDELRIQRDFLELKKTSLEKQKQKYQNLPQDETISAYCTDYTLDLSGMVGTIEIPGEYSESKTNIQPGHEENAVYNPTRDGQLIPTLGISAAATFYNAAILPGWQKWKPLHRYGTLSALDHDTNTATVTLEAAQSSQQSLDVNQGTEMESVEIDYMSCNSYAFEDGDDALIEFTGQAYESPKVIGFKTEPQPCGYIFKIMYRGTVLDHIAQGFAWTLANNFPSIIDSSFYSGDDLINAPIQIWSNMAIGLITPVPADGQYYVTTVPEYLPDLESWLIKFEDPAEYNPEIGHPFRISIAFPPCVQYPFGHGGYLWGILSQSRANEMWYITDPIPLSQNQLYGYYELNVASCLCDDDIYIRP